MATLALVITACGPRVPEADFTAQPLAGAAPLTVQFTDASRNGPTEWKWQFGDGNTSIEQSPEHRYESAGPFEVTLTASNEAGEDTAAKPALVAVMPGTLDLVEVSVLQPGGLAVGGRHNFIVEAYDAFNNLIPDVQVTWAAESAGVISPGGLFTAGTAAGEFPDAVKAVVKWNGATRTEAVDVTVLPGSLDTVRIVPQSPSVSAGDTEALSLVAEDRHGNLISPDRTQWEVTERAGIISQNGTLTPTTRVGTYREAVTATLTVEGVTASATADLTVAPGPLVVVEVEPLTHPLTIGEEVPLAVNAFDAFDNPISTAKVDWSVTGEANSITPAGVLMGGTQAGEFRASATLSFGGKTVRGTAELGIVPDPLYAVLITPESAEVVAGGSFAFTGTAVDQYDNPIPNLGLAWRATSSGGVVARAGERGLFTANVRAGEYGPTVEAEATIANTTVSGTASVTVLPAALSQLVLVPGQVELGMSMTQQYVAVGGDRYGNHIDGLDLTWSIANGGGANGGGAIDEAGLFTAAEAPGSYPSTVRVEASEGDVARTATGSVTVEPDRLLVLFDRDNVNFDYYVMDAGAGTVKRVTEGADINLVSSAPWSPDGRRIAYESGFRARVVSDDGSWGAGLSAGFQVQPAWSPDGSKFAVASFEGFDWRIAVMDVDGGNLTLLGSLSSDGVSPSWSPDGAQIAFISNRDGNDELYTMEADGSNEQRLTFTPESEGRPIWSPDGNEILFESGVFGLPTTVYVINRDGSDMRQLTLATSDSGCPSWSPDGEQFAFHSTRDAATAEIYIADRDGSNVRRVTDNSTDDLCPRWAPRKRGLWVTAEMVSLDTTSRSSAMGPTALTAWAQPAVVRVVPETGESGSGFIIDTNGMILTTNEVVGDAESATVILADGSRFEATVLGRDMVRDVALLQIESGEPLPFLPLLRVTGPELGDQVLMMGYPSQTRSLTISWTSIPSLPRDAGSNLAYVQIGGFISPGNSGAPLLNMRGEAVGMVTTRPLDVTLEGVSLAISSSTLRNYLELLKAGEVLGQGD